MVRGRGRGQPTTEGSTGKHRSGPRTRGRHIGLQRGEPITRRGPIGLQRGRPRTRGGPTGLQRGRPITRSGGRGHIQGIVHTVRLYGPSQFTPSRGSARVSKLFFIVVHLN
jgi:hypothetical protein